MEQYIQGSCFTNIKLIKKRFEDEAFVGVLNMIIIIKHIQVMGFRKLNR